MNDEELSIYDDSEESEFLNRFRDAGDEFPGVDEDEFVASLIAAAAGRPKPGNGDV
jgi:hypothetical protein